MLRERSAKWEMPMATKSTTRDGIAFLTTPPENFAGISDFPYETHYVDLDGLQLAFIDEGPRDAPVMLMVHGMPTWSYLYRHMIKAFLAKGFRCVAPDHIGFGKSSKVVEPDWYSITRHADNLTRLIDALNLMDVTLIVQDWGGPIGLSQYQNSPQRFSRLVIMNTWLHHDTYEYSPGIQSWISQNSPGGIFRDNVPEKFNWGTLMAMSTQRVSPQDSLFAIMSGEEPRLSEEALAVKVAYDAPFIGLGEQGVSGPRRFPMSIPANGTNTDNAVKHQQVFATVNQTMLPVHFVWGIADNVFTKEWGLKWHSMIPHSSWYEVDGGHFLQDTHGNEIAEHVLTHFV